jgi:Spy/CpxP family protein refolding chaperone
MQFHSKTALAVLAVALSCTPVFAQGEPPAPPASGPHADMGPGHDGRQWRRGKQARFAGHWGEDRGGRRFGGEHRRFELARLLRNPDVRQKLGISAEQFNKIQQQETDFRKTEIRDRADVQVKQLELRSLLSAEKPDRAAIDAKLQDISNARLAMQKNAIDSRLTMREAITPQQRQQLRQLMSERRGRGRGPGPESHSGPHGQGRGRSPQSNRPPDPSGQPNPPRNSSPESQS